ncbi:MAG: Rid family hydrolase [Solirubrobacteraceae bacterium]
MQRVPGDNEYAERFGYSRAVRRAGVIEVAGTVAAGPDAYSQAIAAMEKVIRSVESLGGGVADIIRTRMFVVDIARHAEDVGRAHAESFGLALPASAMYGVAALIAPGLLVEVEATAVLDA